MGIEKSLNTMYQDLQQLMHFHIKRGLKLLLKNIEVNYERGWNTLKEKSLNQIKKNDYLGFADLIDILLHAATNNHPRQIRLRGIEKLDRRARQILFLPMDDILKAKKESILLAKEHVHMLQDALGERLIKLGNTMVTPFGGRYVTMVTYSTLSPIAMSFSIIAILYSIAKKLHYIIFYISMISIKCTFY